MKKLIGFLCVSAMVLGMTTNAFADYKQCYAYDVAGITNDSPIESDGKVTYGEGVWWEDDIMACYNVYLQPAYLPYFPGCDHDGSGLVEATEVLDMYYYVLDYPTSTPDVYSHTCPVPTCDDLSEKVDNSGTIHFGAGYGVWADGACHGIIVSYIPDDVAFFDSIEDCQAHCGDRTPSTWSLDRINQRNLPLDNRGPGAGGANVHIYLVGTGIEFDHQEFENVNGHTRAHPFFDFQPSNGGSDTSGMGTYLASLAAGNYYGAAKDAQVYSVRVVDSHHTAAADSDILAGLNHIFYNGTLPGIVVYAYNTVDPLVRQALQNLQDEGFEVVTAAESYPVDVCDTALVDTLVVSATNSSDAITGFSGFGPCVDIFAPGQDVTGAWLNNGTRTLSGTNSAAALAAGALAHYKGNVSQLLVNASTHKISDVPAGTPNLLIYL